MNIKPFLIVAGVATAVILGDANPAQARGFGNRGGISIRIGIGIGGSPYRAPRYYGPGFYAAPQFNRRYRPGGSQYQLRPWYYYRSGPYEYYRPYNQLYRTR